MSLPLATDVLATLAGLGTREFCVCGGARNAALLAVLAQSRGLRLWSFAEERCAGFFACGRAMRNGQPVAVITTSGTAAAELLPAAIEAHYQNLPLILLTADRPIRFRGTGAPQAIEQVGLFGPYVSSCVDLNGATLTDSSRHAMEVWNQRGPLHVNLCLEEPADLDGAEGILCGYSPPRQPEFSEKTDSLLEFIREHEGLVVVVGTLKENEREDLVSFLQRLACPVYAEATSGLREHPLLAPLAVRRDSDFAALNPRKILRIGGVPVSRFWRDLESRREVEVLSVTRARGPGLARPSTVCGIPRWSRVIPAETPARAEMISEKPVLENPGAGGSWGALVSRLSEAIPAGSLVFLGNSLPVRQWNQFASREDRGFRCFANRGANGIDGAVSTFFGLSADEAESWCVIGDLTALYDLAAPWILRQLPRARRRLVVLNNHGGQIFHQVSGLQALEPAAWPLIENPHRLDFRAWAAFWRMGYRKVENAEQLAPPIEDEAMVLELDAGQ